MTFTRASPATYINAAGDLVEVGADVPRYNYTDGVLDGLLIERISTTNGIRNPRMEGAVVGVVGAGGALPTNMSISGAGFSVEVFGVVTVKGIPMLDVGFTGTGATTGTFNFEVASGCPMVGSTAYTASVHAAMIGGSLTNVTFFHVRVRVDAATAANGAGTDFKTTIGAVPTRYSAGYTTAADATAGRGVQLIWNTSGNAFTRLLLGAPQFEQGSLSSVVLPPVGVPAATTRAADLVNLDPTLIDLDKSSLVMRFRIDRGGLNVAAPITERLFVITDGASNNNMLFAETFTAGVFPRVSSRRAAATTIIQASAVGSGAFQTVAVAWGDNESVAAWAGAVPTVVASSPIGPATAFRIGATPPNSNPGNLVLAFIDIYKGLKLSSSQVQAASARIS
jgi:hypothetical protein